MKRVRNSTTRTRWLSVVTLILTASLTGEQSVQAELVLQSSSGTVTYSIYSTAAGPASGTFSDFSSNYGMLTAAGKSMPELTYQVNNSSQSYSTSALNPTFTTSATTTPGNFGSASTQIYTGYSGSEGNTLTQGGVYWSTGTKLADNLGGSTNLASVSYSTATATYINNGSSNITIHPGSLLSITGTLGGSGSFIAAGLSTDIILGSGDSSIEYSVNPIILASNGVGTTVASTGSASNDFASVIDNNGVVTGSASSLISSITLTPGEVVSVSSYLTLISDPRSKIEITDAVAPGETDIPDFGGYGNVPLAAVPEPSTVVLLGSGLAVVGFWARANRRRPAKA